MRINRLIMGAWIGLAIFSCSTIDGSKNITDIGCVFAAEKLSAKSDPAKLKAKLAEINVRIKEEPSAALYAYKANLLDYLKDTKGAVESISSAIKLNPKESRYFYYRSVIYRRMYKNAEALTDLDKTIELGDKSTDLYIDRALIKAALNDNEGAVADAKIALKFHPNSSGAWYAKGCGERSLGKSGDSIRSLTRSIQLNPDSAGAFVERALAYKESGLIKESNLDFKKARKLGWDGKL